jgi:hypothetical protein
MRYLLLFILFLFNLYFSKSQLCNDEIELRLINDSIVLNDSTNKCLDLKYEIINNKHLPLKLVIDDFDFSTAENHNEDELYVGLPYIDLYTKRGDKVSFYQGIYKPAQDYILEKYPKYTYDSFEFKEYKKNNALKKTKDIFISFLLSKKTVEIPAYSKRIFSTKFCLPSHKSRFDTTLIRYDIEKQNVYFIELSLNIPKNIFKFYLIEKKQNKNYFFLKNKLTSNRIKIIFK